MTGPVPDLAALREWVDLYLDPARSPARPTTLSWPVVELAAVLSLVDDLRAENERLREALERIEQICNGAWSHESITHIASGALAGSLAANEEQQ